MWNSCKSVFSNTRELEQDEIRQRLKTEEEGTEREVSMEKSKEGTKKRNPDGRTIARAYRPSGIDTPKVMDESRRFN